MKQKHYTALAILNLLAYIGMLTVNALANILPINEVSTAEISDSIPNLFVPAGLTFSIWGLIYLLLLGYLLYQYIILSGKRNHKKNFIRKISLLFIITCALNAGWIFTWHYKNLHASVFLMVILLLALIYLYHRLEVGKKGISPMERYLVHLPFSIYLGWISIASIANITALLVDTGWNRWGLSEEFWTVTMMMIGAGLAVAMALLRRDIFYGLVVIWALLGIIFKRMEVGGDSGVVTTGAFLAIGLVFISQIIQVIRKKVY
jgi:hypothetical protein